jgi:hypothetical protein
MKQAADPSADWEHALAVKNWQPPVLAEPSQCIDGESFVGAATLGSRLEG